MKNAGKACNNRLYRHIRTFEKIVKNYFVIYCKIYHKRARSLGIRRPCPFYCRWSPIAGSTVFTSAIRNQYCRHYSANHKRVHPTAILRDGPFLFAFRLLADIHPALGSGGCFQLLQGQLDGSVTVARCKDIFPLLRSYSVMAQTRAGRPVAPSMRG